jgi:predicted  nucleic acid-binding Zn-ribbon protein
MSTESEIRAEIIEWEAIIVALRVQLAASVGTSSALKHKMNDGQIQMETEYRSPSAITDDITKARQQINILKNQLGDGISYVRNNDINYRTSS